MPSVAPSAPRPTNAAPLPRLLAYAQALGLERHLSRPKRGTSTLVLALVGRGAGLAGGRPAPPAPAA